MIIKVISNKRSSSLPVLVGYKGTTPLPKDEAYPTIELREENGKVRAYNVKGELVPIPSFPHPKANMSEWLRGCSPSVLEAARLYYYDKWMWDSGEDKYRDLVEQIEAYTRIRYTEQDAGFFYCPYIPLGMSK